MARHATSEIEEDDGYSEADTSTLSYNKKNKTRSKSKFNGDSDLTSEMSEDNEGIELDDDEEDEEEDEVDEEDEDDEEDEEEEEEEEEIPSVSDEEENYQLEDPDEIDENLELEEEDEEYEEPAQIKKIDYSARYKTETKNPAPSSGAREARKRQLSYFEEEEDEEDESEEVQSTSRKSRRIPQAEVQPQDLDADLILTDEEQEYNPRANPDLSKMTERQRARYLEDEDKKNEFVELDESLMNLKKTRTKKKETEEEATLRKAESARRRQDYKMKQLEEEKRDTVNKLLKRRANKTREVNPAEGSVDVHKQDLKERRPVQSHPALFKYVSNTTTLNGNCVLAFNSA